MIAQQLTIREATSLDRSYILDVNRQTWEQCYTHIFDDDEMQGLFDNTLPQHGSWVYRRDAPLKTFVAEIDGKIIGFIGIASLLNPSLSEITTFYILPDYHGCGIGKQLWQSAIQYLRAERYSGVWVWTLERATQALKFYQAQNCQALAFGIYSIGQHREQAVGFWLDL